jgi:hypothetical protein
MHCCGEQTSQATESDEAEEDWFPHFAPLTDQATETQVRLQPRQPLGCI